MGVGVLVAALLITLMQGVLCKTWAVTMPKSIVGIRGSCITIPCRFEVPANQEKNIQNCSNGGIWMKGSLWGGIVFTSQKPKSTSIQGKIDGDLTEKNCTSTIHRFPEEYSDVLFFRLDCSEILRFTFTDGVNITVQPGPSPPLMSSVGQVSEGAQVTLQCSVPVPCSTLPPSLTWLSQDPSRKEQTHMQQERDGQMIMTSTLTFIASADHHNQSVACCVSYPLTVGGSTWPSTTNQRLKVLYAPRFTVATLSPSAPVSEGRTVAFTCRADANPPVSLYTWYRADGGKWTKKGEGEILSLQVGLGDAGLYLCEAQTRRGSQRSTPVHLQVTVATDNSEYVVVTPYSPYIMCGVLLVLYILIVVVDVYKYNSLSRRLKQMELKGEHTYADLRTSSVGPDYDHLQPRQPKAKPPPDSPNYENLQKLACKPVSKVNLDQSGSEGLC